MSRGWCADRGCRRSIAPVELGARPGRPPGPRRLRDLDSRASTPLRAAPQSRRERRLGAADAEVAGARPAASGRGLPPDRARQRSRHARRDRGAARFCPTASRSCALFVSAGQHVVETERLDAVSLGAIAEEAVALIGGRGGRGACARAATCSRSWRAPSSGVGRSARSCRREGTASGRAITTGRTVVSGGASASSQSAALALPLTIGDRVLGVLEVRLPASALPVSPERVCATRPVRAFHRHRA